VGLLQRIIEPIVKRYYGGVTTQSLYALAMSLNNDEGTLIEITPESAHKLNTVHACINLITETYSLIVPEIKYSDDKGTFKDTKHDQNVLLQREPNNLMSSVEWRKMMVADMFLQGVGYSKIVRNPRTGRPTAYKYLKAGTVATFNDLENNIEYYRYTSGNVNEIIKPKDMIVFSDLFGESRIMQNATTLQEYDAVRKYGRDMFKNGSFISGYIFGDKPLSAEAGDNLLKAFKNRTAKKETPILPHGYKYEPLQHTLPMGTAGYALAKSTTDRDVCRIFGTPPSLVGVSEHADNKGETDFNTFLSTTIAPVCTLAESELSRKIFRPVKEDNYFVDHNLTGIYRFSMKEKHESYRIAINAGYMCPDEVREELGMNPDPNGNGKVFMRQLNMVPATLWDDYMINLIAKKTTKK